MLFSQLRLVEVNYEHTIEFRVPQRVWRPDVTVTDTKLVDLAMRLLHGVKLGLPL